MLQSSQYVKKVLTIWKRSAIMRSMKTNIIRVKSITVAIDRLLSHGWLYDIAGNNCLLIGVPWTTAFTFWHSGRQTRVTVWQ